MGLTRFVIRQTLNGKWRLQDTPKDGDLAVDIGMYDAEEDARHAVDLILNPVTFYFSEDGSELDKDGNKLETVEKGKLP